MTVKKSMSLFNLRNETAMHSDGTCNAFIRFPIFVIAAFAAFCLLYSCKSEPEAVCCITVMQIQTRSIQNNEQRVEFVIGKMRASLVASGSYGTAYQRLTDDGMQRDTIESVVIEPGSEQGTVEIMIQAEKPEDCLSDSRRISYALMEAMDHSGGPSVRVLKKPYAISCSCADR